MRRIWSDDGGQGRGMNVVMANYAGRLRESQTHLIRRGSSLSLSTALSKDSTSNTVSSCLHLPLFHRF